jgi:hypothetical protein
MGYTEKALYNQSILLIFIRGKFVERESLWVLEKLKLHY